jgi:hypothetical protein
MIATTNINQDFWSCPRKEEAVGAVYDRATFRNSFHAGRYTVIDAVKELSPEDRKNVAVWDRPSWPQEGWLRLKQKDSKYLIGAAGVVVKPQLKCDEGNIHHPVCGNKVLRDFFFMPQPPLLWPGGAIPDRNILPVLGAHYRQHDVMGAGSDV